MAIDYRVQLPKGDPYFALKQRQAQLGIQQQERQMAREEQAASQQQAQAIDAQKIQRGLMEAVDLKTVKDPVIRTQRISEYMGKYQSEGNEQAFNFLNQLSVQPVEVQDQILDSVLNQAQTMGYEVPKQLMEGPEKSASLPREIAITNAIRELRASGDPGDAAQADQLEKMAVQGKTGIPLEQKLEEATKLKFAEESSKQGAQILANYNKEAQSAAGQEATLDQMSKLLDEGIPTGPISGRVIGLKALASDLGMPVDTEKLAGQEGFRALGNQLALRLRNPESGFGLTGSTSDRDLTFLKDSVPGIVKTEAGNRMVIKMSKQIIEQKKRIARVAEAYAERNGSMMGWNDYLSNWKEENPIFSSSDMEEAQKAFGQEEQAPGRPAEASPVKIGRFEVQVVE